MINQEKVCDMTKMAAYEDRFGSRELKICMFRRKDFVALEMIKSFFLGTVSYAVILVLYLFCHPEFIDRFNTFASMKKYGIRIGIAYVIFLGAYLVLTFFMLVCSMLQHKKTQQDICARSGEFINCIVKMRKIMQGISSNRLI